MMLRVKMTCGAMSIMNRIWKREEERDTLRIKKTHWTRFGSFWSIFSFRQVEINLCRQISVEEITEPIFLDLFAEKKTENLPNVIITSNAIATLKNFARYIEMNNMLTLKENRSKIHPKNCITTGPAIKFIENVRMLCVSKCRSQYKQMGTRT